MALRVLAACLVATSSAVHLDGNYAQADVDCAACIAVSDELARLLRKERAEQEVDVTAEHPAHTGSSRGSESRVFEYHLSEERVAQVIQGACSALADYGDFSSGDMPYFQRVDDRAAGAATTGGGGGQAGSQLARHCDALLESRKQKIVKILRVGAGDPAAVASQLCVAAAKQCEPRQIRRIPTKVRYPELFAPEPEERNAKATPPSRPRRGGGAAEAPKAIADEQKAAPQAGEAPKAKAAPKAGEAPKAKAAPKAGEAPKAKAAPGVREAPKAISVEQMLSDIRAGRRAPKAEAAPEAGEAPKAKAAPKAGEAPKAKAAPKAREAPKAKAAPKAREAPKAKAAPKANEAPKRREGPKVEGYRVAYSHGRDPDEVKAEYRRKQQAKRKSSSGKASGKASGKRKAKQKRKGAQKEEL